jgi:hypothetical protein
MKTASWIVLVVVGGLLLLASLVSLGRAYLSAGDRIGSVSLADLSAGRPEVATAVRARRATAAAFAAGFATLFLAIALGPYRRGDAWAWWALAAGTLVVSGLMVLRIFFLGTQLGASGAITQLVGVGLGLALGAGRLGGSKPPA